MGIMSLEIFLELCKSIFLFAVGAILFGGAIYKSVALSCKQKQVGFFTCFLKLFPITVLLISTGALLMIFGVITLP